MTGREVKLAARAPGSENRDMTSPSSNDEGQVRAELAALLAATDMPWGSVVGVVDSILAEFEVTRREPTDRQVEL